MKWAFILELLLGHPSHNVSMDTVELHGSYGIWCIWFGSTGDIDNFQHMTIVELDFEG
jgi:hypothetical protein